MILAMLLYEKYTEFRKVKIYSINTYCGIPNLIWYYSYNDSQ